MYFVEDLDKAGLIYVLQELVFPNTVPALQDMQTIPVLSYSKSKLNVFRKIYICIKCIYMHNNLEYNKNYALSTEVDN